MFTYNSEMSYFVKQKYIIWITALNSISSRLNTIKIENINPLLNKYNNWTRNEFNHDSYLSQIKHNKKINPKNILSNFYSE